jgi:MFS family permease
MATPTKSVSLGWQQAIEPWYLAYALVAVAVGGLGPIMIPLTVDRSAGGAAHVGLVMAANGLGQLSAALWGGLADRSHLHRVLFAGGSLGVAVALSGFHFLVGLPLWITLALLLGFGTAAVQTTANLLVVEAHPEDEWDARVGWLQTFFSAGSVLGLVIAGSLGHLPPGIGVLSGGGFAFLGMLYGWFTTHNPPLPGMPKARDPRPGWLRHRHGVFSMPIVPWVHNIPHHHFTFPSGGTLRRLGSIARSPLALFLVVWFLCAVSPAAIYALYPILMEKAYGVNTQWSSFAMAASTGVALFMYAPVSLLVHRIGARRVLQSALGLRLVALVLMFLVGFVAIAGRDWVAIAGFFGVQLAWPLMSVSSIVLTSSLATGDEGEANGIYNTVGGLGAMVGSAVGGWLVSLTSYDAAAALGAVAVALALPLTLFLSPVHHRQPEPAAPPPTAA